MKRDERVFKNNRLLAVLASCLIFATLTASTCDDDDDDNGNAADIAAVKDDLSDGTWRVTYMFDDTDETSDFSGYTFTFNDDGTANAVSGVSTVTGNWSVRHDDGQLELDLDFGTTNPWDDIEDDWDIKERSETKLVLEDESGGDGSVDYLTLEKN